MDKLFVMPRAFRVVSLFVLLINCSVRDGVAAELPVVSKINILGNKAFGNSQIKQWLGLMPGKVFSRAAVRQHSLALLRELSSRGFLFARVDSVGVQFSQDSSQVDISIMMTEGDRAKLAEFRVDGSAQAAGDLTSEFNSQGGKRFRNEALENDIEMIIRRHEQNGYPYCQVTIEDFAQAPLQDGKSGILIRLVVAPGPQVHIDDIAIRGSEQTREFVILRELPMRVGDVYDQREVDKIRSKLMRLGFFKWVNPPVLMQLDDDKHQLLIELAEGNHNRFDGVLGYNPSTRTSKSFITGLLDIRFGNLLGTGRQIDAHWQRRSEQTQELSLRYTEPWLAGWPINLAGGFEQTIQDTSYVSRKLAIDVTFLFNDNLSFSSSFARSAISPDSLGALRLGIPPSRSLSFGLGVAFDTTDDLLNPRQGVKYATSVEWTRKTIDTKSASTEDAAGSFNQRRLSIDFENYFRLFRWQVAALALHGRETKTAEDLVQITDQYRFGGTRTLRGYREEQFRGSRIAWSNFEYRYLLGPRSRLFLFTDLGYFFREQRQANGSLQKFEGFQVGYGFGLRLETRLGFFGIDYGLGEGDGFSDGKIHIGLINEF